MTTKERIAKALAVATDTKVFEMDNNILHLAPSIFKEQFGEARAIVIADKNTWRVAGEEVYNHLVNAGIYTVTHIIQQDEFHAEWCYVMEVEEAAKKAGAIMVSVGSGVINDLCKLASHHLKQQYLTIPTAASVDGYSSFGASISYEGLKQTFDCPAPQAILADIDVIANAPKEMTAAGYADLAAKIPCGGEWMIADIMGAEPIIPEAWHVLQDVLDEQLSNPDGVAKCEKEAIANLFEGLTLSGFAMQAARSSRPASCADHLFSHYLDMTHHTFNGKLQSHGFQVAIGTLTMCAFFDALLELDLRNIDIDKCIENWPSLEEEQQRAREIFKDFVSPELGYNQITIKYSNKASVREQLETVKKHWPLLRAQYRKQVYPFEKMQECFRKVGAPADPADIGVTRQQLKDMLPFVQLMRWRMNMFDLALRGGFYEELVEKVFGKGGAWEIA